MRHRSKISKLDKRLLKSAWNGYHQEVKALVTSGANVNIVSDYTFQPLGTGYTPLMLAARQGDFKCLNTLIQLGANVNYGQVRNSVLIQAINSDHISCARALLRAGAKLNQASFNGRNELMSYIDGHCTSDQKIKMSGFLIDEGADIDCEDRDGHTILTQLMDNGYLNHELFIFMLEKGCNPLKKNKRGVSPIEWAKLHNKRDYLIIMENHVERITLNKEIYLGQHKADFLF